jgi:transposase InsO family protein
MKASTCKDTFMKEWIAHFGVPVTVKTLRGAQFTSSMWKDMCSQLNIKPHHGLPPSEQFNGEKNAQADQG